MEKQFNAWSDKQRQPKENNENVSAFQDVSNKFKELLNAIFNKPEMPKYLTKEFLWEEEYARFLDMANRGNLDEDLFLEFIQQWDTELCKAISFNPNNKFPAILDKLSYHENEDVRMFVALRTATPMETLKRLYKNDESSVVRTTAYETIIDSPLFFEKLSKTIDLDKLIGEL